MKCSRCGKEIKKVSHSIKVRNEGYRCLCENCAKELYHFLEGRNLCNCVNSYTTVMYDEPVFEEGAKLPKKRPIKTVDDVLNEGK